MTCPAIRMKNFLMHEIADDVLEAAACTGNEKTNNFTQWVCTALYFCPGRTRSKLAMSAIGTKRTIRTASRQKECTNRPRRTPSSPLFRLMEPQSSMTSAFSTAAVTTEDKGNAEVLTYSYLDCLGDGPWPFHLQGSGT
jgi:hypothetical protein